MKPHRESDCTANCKACGASDVECFTVKAGSNNGSIHDDIDAPLCVFCYLSESGNAYFYPDSHPLKALMFHACIIAHIQNG